MSHLTWNLSRQHASVAAGKEMVTTRKSRRVLVSVFLVTRDALYNAMQSTIFFVCAVRMSDRAQSIGFNRVGISLFTWRRRKVYPSKLSDVFKVIRFLKGLKTGNGQGPRQRKWCNTIARDTRRRTRWVHHLSLKHDLSLYIKSIRVNSTAVVGRLNQRLLVFLQL